MPQGVSCRVLATFLLVLTAACRRDAAGPAAGPLAITLHPSETGRPAFLDVTGLSGAELASLRDARLSPADWPAVLKVTVGERAADGVPPVQGRYEVTDTSVVFTPLFPFDPGRAYQAAFDPARLPTPRRAAPVTSAVRLDAPPKHPTTEVTAIYPSADVLPENTLRLYIEFSAPMGSRGATDVVRVVDERGQEVPIPFVHVEADFWNGDHTRYTLLFDPGRVKQGIKPNEDLGRPLHAGRRYTIEVLPDWRDANGQPLKTAYRRTFRVGPAAARPLSMADWRFAPPAAGTRDALAVTFPAPLDHGLLARALAVEAPGGEPLAGEVTLEAADTRWLFRPAAPWAPGEYRLAALSVLEDPAGNRIGRAFEVDMTAPAADTPPETFRQRFTIIGR